MHVLTYLFTIWSVDVRCAVRYSHVGSLEEATMVKVVPHKFVGNKEVVPIESKDSGEGTHQRSFTFRKLRFIWCDDECFFKKLKYPTKKTFSEYRKSTGHRKESEVEQALEKWGPNKFEVPIPSFQELMQEQLLAPFFCFQVFCVALWAIDEYWYYSLLTLFMLVTFESTVVHQRQRNLSQVRALQQPPKPVMVYRYGTWAEISGEKLVPGDIVSVARPKDSESTVIQADMLLLAGTCIVDEAVLTGESTPQWKNPIGEASGDEIDSSEVSSNDILSMKRHKMHILFGGTKLMQASGDKEAHIKTPDGGCLAVVLRTGFGTAQGRLMRTILYSTERVSANNLETFIFILFLLMWAIAASAYVLKHGLADPDRDRFKLILNCIMILTSVVPPELPMELTIAVNASLVALARKRVFCTEPFRIPYAGKITTCCFDKTGTLTSDHMEMEGVSGSSENDTEMKSEIEKLPSIVPLILSCCQSLVKVDEDVVGDPVEVAALKATKWKASGDVVSSSNGRQVANVLHRFHFSSSLKRMSTVVRVDEKDTKKTSHFVLIKGAPETIQTHLKSIPAYYDKCYKKYASEGARVLALAYKSLPSDLTPSSLRHLPRDEAESDMVFAGFAIFRSPLKPQSEPSLRMLKASQHQLIMITGDAPLTACHTAGQVHIVSRQAMILHAHGPTDLWKWKSPDEFIEEKFSLNMADALTLAENYDLCIPGDGLLKMINEGEDVLNMYVPLTQVFARVTPDQKELIVKVLRDQELSVLMCGDGTNDVGALKGADVGVALLTPAEKKKKDPKQPKPVGKGTLMIEDMRRRGVPVTPFHERMAKMMDDMAAEGSEPPLVQPGDASMAAPFTAKEPSIKPCLDIIRQGRCTLVTTMQMFKILGLLSLSTAYSLSVLYLDGIKLGDMQATLAGVLTAGMFFFISNGKPLDSISRQRPHPRIFSMYMFISLMGQFMVHMGFLMHMQATAHAIMAPEDRQEPGGDFKPNLVNTVCFLTNFAIQTMTFAVNYVGKPWTTSLSDNTMFALSVRWSVAMYVLLSLDVVSGLNSWFSLVALPWELKYKAIVLGAGSAFACRFIENWARNAFPCAIPPEKGGKIHNKFKKFG
jgi:cation-transporting ATPase 13A1